VSADRDAVEPITAGRLEAVRLKAEISAAREAAREKSDLVATVSHELRTPLASVLGFVELLMHRELDEATRQRYLQTIHGETQRLAELIDDFLDLEKIDAGRFTLELASFELGELLRHEADVFSAQSVSHSLEFADTTDPLAMVGDRNRIGQVMANLLSNAIKYSPAGGIVKIAATSREGFARVSVSDCGLGIPAAQQARVFTKFFRADSSDTREIGGTGLGLALCRQIVSAHGGRIGFESTEGVGSTFWFELPTACRAPATAHGGRLLVIEDEMEIATPLAKYLAPDGLEVESAPTGVLGLERALAAPPAMICLGIDLPGELDGWQVLVRLKGNETTEHIPVIICADANERSVAATLGAAAFVEKPFTIEQLGGAVARVSAADRPSVLVVAGDQALRRLVVETLARDGGELREAADDMDAVALIAAHKPHALVLDLAHPGLDGFAAISRLLERPQARGLPIVVLTDRELSPSEQAYLERRSASILHKSKYSGDELRRLVQCALPGSAISALLGARDTRVGSTARFVAQVQSLPGAGSDEWPGINADIPATDAETRPHAA
jgi:DNA-binding response OmpR family regulator